MNKSHIRKKILKLRKQNNKNYEINFENILKILKKEKIKEKVIGGYYPYNYEIDVIKVLERLEKKNYLISLPRIKKNYRMDFFQWSTKDPLKINKFGIPEPCSDLIKYPSILLVPLVAFDIHNNRIGYGGGFYDRYSEKISQIKKCITIGLAFSHQKVNKINVEKFDRKLDLILTEELMQK